MAPQGLPPLAHHEGADLAERPLPADRLPGRSSTTRRPSRRRTARRAWTRSIPSCSRPTRSWASRCTSARSWPGWPWTRSSTASPWPPPSGRSSRRWASSSARSRRRCRSIPSSCEKYLGSVVPYTDNFFADAQLRGLLRRLVLLHPQGRALPDGAVHLLPHQRRQHRPVRAHADRGRGGRLRQLPRGLHRAHPRREPAARRRGRAGRPRRRADQVLDGAELVPGRQGRQGRHLQLRDQARQVPGAQLQDLLDPGGDRLRHHLEVPELHPAGRRLGRRVLLGGADQQLPAGRHRHQDDPHRQEHALAPSSPRASPPATARTPTAAW